MTRIDFLRHGEPEGGNRYRGSGTDHLLSELGWRQMWAAVDGKPGWDAVVSSPMIRCQAFAEAVAGSRGLPLEVIHDLREAGYGAWEGRTPTEICTVELAAYRALYADPLNCRPAGAEPLDVFTNRVTQAWRQVMEQYAGQHVLLVSHTGTMRAILNHVLDAPMASQQRISLNYAAFFSLQRDDMKGIQILL